MSLPSLARLSLVNLGPPTGPMAQYGEVLESGGKKRQKGDDALSISIVRWGVGNEPQQTCLLTLREFVPGEWVYKTPQGRPYDPWALLQLWIQQTADCPHTTRFFNPSTNQNDIPLPEFTMLAAWEHQHKESERPESPLASPLDVAN